MEWEQILVITGQYLLVTLWKCRSCSALASTQHLEARDRQQLAVRLRAFVELSDRWKTLHFALILHQNCATTHMLAPEACTWPSLLCTLLAASRRLRIQCPTSAVLLLPPDRPSVLPSFDTKASTDPPQPCPVGARRRCASAKGQTPERQGSTAEYNQTSPIPNGAAAGRA